MTIITGEKIQALCSYVFNIGNRITGNHGYPIYNGTPLELAQLSIAEIIQQRPQSIFVFGHDIPTFFEFFNQIPYAFVLVTHNSDIGVTEKYRSYLDDPKIIKWFAQNVEMFHEKLIPLPIGLANFEWPHGDLTILQTVIAEQQKKMFSVTKCFDPTTAPHRRMHVDLATSANGIEMSPKKPYIDYLREIARSLFTICPMGNGVDTHRVWESLYLGAIPIVADCPHFQGFTDLPMMAVVAGEHGNWNRVTIPILNQVMEKMLSVTYKTDKLDLAYWAKRIKEGV